MISPADVLTALIALKVYPPSGGASSKVASGFSGDWGTASATAFSTKAAIFIPSVNMTATAINAIVQPAVASQQHLIGIAEAEGLTGEAGNTLFTSAALSVTDILANRFQSACNVPLTASTPYLLFVTLVPGANTEAVRVGNVVSPLYFDANAPGITPWNNSFQYASKALSPGQLPDANGTGKYSLYLDVSY